MSEVIQELADALTRIFQAELADELTAISDLIKDSWFSIKSELDFDVNEALFQRVAFIVEEEWECGGLSYGLYYKYAKEVCQRYLRGEYDRRKDNSSPPISQ
jgi:hypothetical protein